MESSKFSEMIDAYVLTSVLVYSAIFATQEITRFVLSGMGSIVLLINSHYLHAPVHVPSTVLALCVFGIPLTGASLQETVIKGFHAASSAPAFVAEFAFGLILLTLFVRQALYKPLISAVENRRRVVPIDIDELAVTRMSASRTDSGETLDGQEQVTEFERKEHGTEGEGKAIDRTAKSVSVDEAREAAQARLQGENTVVGREGASDETLEAARKALGTRGGGTGRSDTNLEGRTSHEGGAGSESRQNTQAEGRSSAVRYVRPRRRNTQSQKIASEIMRQKREDDRLRAEAIERQQAEVHARSLVERARREERDKAKEKLQEVVLEAREGVFEAKRELAEAVITADKARERRRRAGDQHRISQTEESEKELDAACEHAGLMEGLEASALRDVNAAQARLSDVSDQLQRFRR